MAFWLGVVLIVQALLIAYLILELLTLRRRTDLHGQLLDTIAYRQGAEVIRVDRLEERVKGKGWRT